MRCEPGAPAPKGTIPLSVPELRGNEWRYVKECLDTRWVSSAGPYVDRFERTVAKYVGVKHAVACASGTAALHAALMVCGIQPDDEVLVPALTFIAPANAVRYVGAWPVFMDADPRYWQMDAEKVRDFLTRECVRRKKGVYNRKTGRRVSALLPVHVLGHPCDMYPLLDTARRFSLSVIEDAAESIGARYRGRHTGSMGTAGCLSFNGNKIITTGGGGMLLTNRARDAKQARYLTTQAKDDPVEYKHARIGYNYRMTSIQAAMGCAQMENLERYVSAKRNSAARYAEALGDVPGLTLMQEAPWASSTFWLYTVLVDRRRFGLDSRSLRRRLDSRGIQSRPLWQPLHRTGAHAGAQAYRIEVADKLHREALSLPSSVGLTEKERTVVIQAVGESRGRR